MTANIASNYFNMIKRYIKQIMTQSTGWETKKFRVQETLNVTNLVHVKNLLELE